MMHVLGHGRGKRKKRGLPKREGIRRAATYCPEKKRRVRLSAEENGNSWMAAVRVRYGIALRVHRVELLFNVYFLGSAKVLSSQEMQRLETDIWCGSVFEI